MTIKRKLKTMQNETSQYPVLGKIAKQRAKSKGPRGWKSAVVALLFVLTAHCSLLTVVHAQGTVQIRSGATVPANCTPKANNGLFYKNSGSNIGLYECTASNTWTYRGAINFGGTLTPSALSGDVNNYNPTGFSSSFAIRIDGGASDRNITGLATGSDGRLVLVTNIGSTNTLTLKDASASSTAANRFLFGADLVIGINQSVLLRYDGTSSRWRQVGSILSNSGVTAGSYGTATQSPTITIGPDGRVTAASNTTIAPPTSALTTTVSGPLAGNGSTVGAATANQIAAPLICTDAGSTDAYVCTAAPVPGSLTNLSLIFTPNTVNTGAATLNANSLGVKNIKKLVGASVSDPADGDLRAGGRYLLSYDGTQFLIVSLLGNAAAGGCTATITTTILLSSTTVNAETATAQTLYVVPASRKAVVTQVVMHTASATLANVQDTVEIDFLSSGNWGTFELNNVTPITDDVGMAMLSGLTSAANSLGNGRIISGTADTIQILFNGVSTTPATVRVDVFGYLTDTSGVPVANVCGPQ